MIFCVFQSCLRLIRFFGLIREWNCAFRVLDLSVSAVCVLSLIFSVAISLGSFFKFLERQYSF